MLLLGYFEELDSERAIAWRASDSLSVRSFLGLELHEAPPDHSTVSRTRRLIDVETHQAVFMHRRGPAVVDNETIRATFGLDGREGTRRIRSAGINGRHDLHVFC
jgi:hypothetical protein